MKHVFLVLALAGCSGAPLGGLGADGGRDPTCAATWNSAQAICASLTLCSTPGKQCIYPGADVTYDGGTTAELNCLDAGYWACNPSP